MKKFYLYLTVLLAFTGFSRLYAQDSAHCNAAFAAFADLNQVEFVAFDSTPGIVHRWNFGDGTLRSTDSSNVFHGYAVTGTYLVTHVVVDAAQHCQDSSSQYVTLGPNCGVSVSETFDTSGHRYTFVANTFSAPGAVDSIRWTINDTLAGAGDTLRKVLTGGPYNVCAHLRTSDGCQSQSCILINPQDSVPSGPPPPPDTCSISIHESVNPHRPNEYRFSIGDSARYSSVTWSILPPDSAVAGPFYGPETDYTFPDTGYYAVRVSAVENSGCPVFSGVYVHIDSLGDGGAGGVASYPNPATTHVTLSVTLGSFSNISIHVYNSMGGLTLSRDQSGYPGVNQITIPLSTLPMGVYYIQIQYGSTILRSKIQKL